MEPGAQPWRPEPCPQRGCCVDMVAAGDNHCVPAVGKGPTEAGDGEMADDDDKPGGPMMGLKSCSKSQIETAAADCQLR